MKTVLIIDGDIVAFQATSIAETEWEWEPDQVIVISDLQEAKAIAIKYVERVLRDTKADEAIITMSCADKAYHRKDILPTYKGNRTGRPPVGLRQIKDFLIEAFESYVYPNLEADDVMGILATHPKFKPDYRKVIVSEDKDLATIPSFLYNPAKDIAIREISEYEADFFFYKQTLMGDTTDGYKGCPQVGEKKAEKVLKDAEADGVPYWEAIVATFVKAGLTEQDALVQAQCARILRACDYNLKKKEVILWTPKPEKT